MKKILAEMFKGKYRTLTWSVLGVALVIVLFMLGLFIGWIAGNVRGGPRPYVYEFETVFTGQNDYRMVRVDVHLSSKTATADLRAGYQTELTRSLRRALDEFFRGASKDTLQVANEGILPSPWLQEKILQRFEKEIEETAGEIKTSDEPLVLAVAIYFLPEGS